MDNKKLENMLRNMANEPLPDDIAEIAKNKSDEFTNEITVQKQNIWRIIMESKATKYSTAALIILVLGLVLINPFGAPGNSGVVLADVQKKIAEIDTMIIKGEKIFTFSNDPNVLLNFCGIEMDFDVVKYISQNQGYVEEGYQQDELMYRIVVNVPKKEMLIVFPKWKKYVKLPSTEEQLEVMNRLSPKGLFEILVDKEFEELGTSYIDGIEVEGFSFEDLVVIKDFIPSFVCDIRQIQGSAWVDVNELVPIRMEANITVGKSLLSFFNEGNLYELNNLDSYGIELSEELFSTDIPDGCTELKFSDFIPANVKAGISGLGAGAVPLGFIILRKRRKRKKAK